MFFVSCSQKQEKNKFSDKVNITTQKKHTNLDFFLSKDWKDQKELRKRQEKDSLLFLFFDKCDSFLELKKGTNYLSKNSVFWKKIPSIFPVAPSTVKRISSLSGLRFHPIDKRYKKHNGIDFSGKPNTPIYATAKGIVERSAYSSGSGNYIKIRHNFGFKTVYAHLNRRLVNSGDSVKQGQIIGLMGMTGKSTGTHLHYEVHKKGKKLKPLDFCLLRVPKSWIEKNN